MFVSENYVNAVLGSTTFKKIISNNVILVFGLFLQLCY